MVLSKPSARRRAGTMQKIYNVSIYAVRSVDVRWADNRQRGG
jgi:hypothetical protein